MPCREPPGLLLRFEPLIEGECVIDIPCEAFVQVDLDALADSDRNTHFRARVVRHQRFAARMVLLNCF
jgi:hypothetical protein